MIYYIITGTSSGIGKSLLENLLENENHQIISISRKKIEEMEEIIESKGSYKHYTFDLNNVNDIENIIIDIISELHLESTKIILINNAGTVNPIKKIGESNSKEIVQNINVNLIAPMLLTNNLIKYSKHIKCKKIILNISSGAAKKAISGWGAYCSSKAGIDMFTSVFAEDYDTENIKMFSLAPGIVDTNMQTTIRKSNEKDFKDKDKFIEYKKTNKLLSTDLVAKTIIDILKNENFENGAVYRIDEFLK